MVSEDGFPAEWTHEKFREEFTKWADILIRVLESLPGGGALWQQSTQYQDLLNRLAFRLEFPVSPFARRKEKFEIAGDHGQEYHEREWLVASDPQGNEVKEIMYTWIDCPTAKMATYLDLKEGFDDVFRAQVLTNLRLWKAAVDPST